MPPEIKRLVATLVTAFVLFTLFFNGLTLRPLIRALGIDRLSPVDQFLRARAMTHSLGAVGHRLDSAAGQYRIDEHARRNLSEQYAQRLRESESSGEAEVELSEEQRLRALDRKAKGDWLTVPEDREFEQLLAIRRYHQIRRVQPGWTHQQVLRALRGVA